MNVGGKRNESPCSSHPQKNENELEESTWEELWGRFPFYSESSAGNPPALRRRADSYDDGDDDMVFGRAYNGANQRASRSPTRESLARPGDGDGITLEGRSTSTSTTPDTLSPSTPISPSSTTSNTSFKLPSALCKRSQPIDIRRPKRVLIQLDTDIIVTPSSNYKNPNTSPSDSDEDRRMIESAILEPRSPPQREKISDVWNNFSGRLRMSGSCSKHETPSSSDEEIGVKRTQQQNKERHLNKDQNRASTTNAEGLLTIAASASLNPRRRRCTVMSESEISVLDIGPSLLKDDRHQQGEKGSGDHAHIRSP